VVKITTVIGSSSPRLVGWWDPFLTTNPSVLGPDPPSTVSPFQPAGTSNTWQLGQEAPPTVVIDRRTSKDSQMDFVGILPGAMPS